ncbi:MBL fold metallo-hydrolase [Patescibacteria group bacterium]|nr:MBL fold metallo-hydrolase [Patescibacteria group bacterium]MBU2632911.1 MBL fold metallo-hydrolase [Patescibacteria group bacterium]
MNIIKIPVGSYQANCYLVANEMTLETIIIDPGDEAGKIIDVIEKNNLKPKQIILTHTHFDHTGAVEEIKNRFNIDVLAPSYQGRSFVDLRIIGTPGHTKDSVCIVCPQEKVIFTGDTLFKNSIGRTDLEGGDYNKIQKSLQKIMQYPDDFKVYPGHGPNTTIGEERRNNPFLK